MRSPCRDSTSNRDPQKQAYLRDSTPNRDPQKQAHLRDSTPNRDRCHKQNL